MYTLLEKNRNWIIGLILVGFISTSFIVIYKTNFNWGSLPYRKFDVSNPNYQAVVFLPNSYLENFVRLSVLSNRSDIYDTSEYDFYSLKASTVEPKSKKLILKLLKKTDQSEFSKMSLNGFKNKQDEMYSLGNFLEKIISVDKNDSILSVTIKGKTNQEFILFKDSYRNFSIHLIDSLMVIDQPDLKNLSFYQKGIVANFSNNNNITDLVKFLESKSEFQNPGVSVIYPYAFLSQIIQNNKIFFYSDNPTLKGTYIKKAAIKNINDEKLEATFEIDSDNRLIFPTSLEGTCIMKKHRNTVMSMDNFKYNPRNLSATQIATMDLLIRICKDSIVPDLINKSLVPTFTETKITTRFRNHVITRPVHSSTIGYFKNYIIYKINLKNE